MTDEQAVKVAFNQGYICCITSMISMFGIDSKVSEAFAILGIKEKSDLKDYRIDAHDKKVLFKHWDELVK